MVLRGEVWLRDRYAVLILVKPSQWMFKLPPTWPVCYQASPDILPV